MAEPYYADDWLTVYAGDCRDVLATLPAESVHCVVTSPPYFGLRDYGEPGQLGLEPTPEQYVENMVAVFREVRRVLRSDGTLWLNLGDTFAAGGKGGGGSYMAERKDAAWQSRSTVNGWRPPPAGLKPKDLVGIPWRVAFALQADGWYLRSDIIWSKPNPMPESVTDRPTKSHEYLFLLAKSPRYYFDADAVREAAVEGTDLGLLRGRSQDGPGADGDRVAWHAPSIAKGQAAGVDSRNGNPTGARNIRSVWTIPTQPYPGAHFAVFPPNLVEPCIKAGTSERGVCAECGAPWRRVVERQSRSLPVDERHGRQAHNGGPPQQSGWYWRPSVATDKGWQPSCAHDAATVPASVLDPFAGSGTVGLVAQRLSRRAVLIDLNPTYIEQQLKRNAALPLGLTG